MGLIHNVNYYFVKTDSTSCSVHNCPHYATVNLVPQDPFYGSARPLCTKHLVIAARTIHDNERARRRWL